jgi:hypothetical protein
VTRRTIHEHWIEDSLTLRLAQAGHLCLKFVSPGFPGVPDRIVISSAGRVAFVECKAPGQKPRRAQPAVIKALRELGHRVEVIDTHAQVDQLLKELAA